MIFVSTIKNTKEIDKIIYVSKNFPNFIKFDFISFEEVLSKGLKVMDTTAFTLSQENELPIIVFDMNTPGNLIKLIKGAAIGTKVQS